MPTASSRILRTDSKTGRFYHITDPVTGNVAQYPSVTTILNCISKPALVPWAAKAERELVSEAAAELYADLHGTPQLPRSMYQLALEQRLGKTKAHIKELTKAAEIGSAIHAAIEWQLKRQLGQRVGAEPMLSDEARWGLMAFEDWAKAVQLRPRAIEQTVWSRTHLYAGTLDLLADLNGPALLTLLERQGPVAATLGEWLRTRDAVTACVDFKSGRAVYPESFLQSCAYSRAVAEMGHGRVDGGLIVRLPKVTSDPAFQVVVVPPARDLFPVFLAARQLWEWSFQTEQARRQARVA
jgi:hypothetical protein